MTATDPEYRAGVGVMLLNRGGLVFVGRRHDMAGEHWQMPQGGIDSGEEPRVAALRELEEEIGTANAEILAETRGWMTYDLPDDLRRTAWKGRYKGQTQKWFAARFLGSDAEINLDTAHPEFEAWQWIEPRRLPEVIVPFKRQLYADLLEEFRAVLAVPVR
jgi:putative (di)nucleoside polyphosphate hydrolase